MIENLKIVISAEIDKLKNAVKQGKQSVNDFAKDSKASLKDFGAAIQQAGDVSKRALAVVGGAIAGTATALLALSETTKEYRQLQAGLKTAFETSGGSAKDATKTYNELYRVLGDTGKATEAAQHLAKLTTNQQHLAEYTKICQGVYATFGDSLAIEGLTEAVNHTAKLGEVQGTLADALEWSGISVDEFNDQLFWCNSESEREALIRDTLNGLYTEAAENYEQNNADVLAQNEAQEKLNAAMAEMGEITAPIMTLLKEFAAETLAGLIPTVKELTDKYLPDIRASLKDLGDIIGAVLKWVIDHWQLVSTLSIIILAIASACSVLSTAIGIVNAVTMAGPWGWVMAAIAAVIAVVVLLVLNWEKVVKFVKENWQALALLLVNPIAGAFKLIYDNCEGFRNFIDGFVAKIKNAIKSAFDWIKNSIINPIRDAFDTVKYMFNNLPELMKAGLNKAKDAVKSIIDKIKGFFKFEWSLPKLKVPKFSITPAGWGVGDLLKGVIPKLSVSWNAKGGVFDEPTLFNYGGSLQGLGENGAEAVVPLENNLEWLDKIASMLSDRMGNNPVVLNVDGKTFAKTAISTINQLTKQTGKLDLAII